MSRRNRIVLLLVAFAGLMAACENATGAPGTMQFIIAGLPAGVNADVTVNGPNGFRQQPPTDVPLGDLDAGSYLVAAANVSSGGETFRPTPSSQSVIVRSGEVTSIRIEYADASTTTGGVDITIGGLPTGIEAPVILSGPSGFLQGVAASDTITGLEPGTYSLAAAELDVAGDIYGPDAKDQTVVVVAGATAFASVTYQQLGLASGELEVIIVGLPVAALAQVTVSNALGFSQTVGATDTLRELTPGEYVITAVEQSVSPYTFAPIETSQTVVVEAGGLARVAVRFTAITSAVSLTIEGLPSGAAAAVTLESLDAPIADPVFVTESTALADLSPGDYRISAAGLDFDGFRFEPEALSVVIGATAGVTTAVTISYRPVDGKILVGEEGLPGNDPVTLGELTGPGLGSGIQLRTDTFLEGLEPGTYRVGERLSSIVINGVTYLVEGVPADLEVQPGQITVVLASFLAQQGDLAIEIGGLPVGFDASVVVTGGGGFNVSVKQSTTLFALEPGTYTISASDVPDEGRDYQPSPAEQTVAVRKARTVTATVTYAKPPVVCCSE